MIAEDCAGKWNGLIYWLLSFCLLVFARWQRPPLSLKPEDKDILVCCSKQNHKKNKLLLTTSQLLILGRHWKFCPGYCLYGNDIWSVLWRHWGSYIISAPTSRWNRQTDDYFSHSCWGMNTLHTRLNRVHSLVFLLKRFWIQGRLQNTGTKAMKRRQRPWDRRQSMFTASFIQPSLAPALAQSRLTSGAMTVTFQNTL